MSFHKDLGTGNIHVIFDQTYADITDREADIAWNGDPTNIGKVVKVTAGPVFFLLETNAPTWLEITTSVSNSLAGALAIGNTSGSSDIIMDAGQGIVIGGGARTLDTALDLKAINQAILMNRMTTIEKNALTPVQGMIVYDTDINEPQHYNGVAWSGVSASDTLAEILAKGNTTAGTDIVVDAGDVITITDSPTAVTDGTNKGYVDAIVNAAIRLQGDWDADTNTPDITGTTVTGFAWRVSVAGSTDLGGITIWAVGDLAVKTDVSWLRIANEDIAAIWGNITGTLANQTDLQTALDLKVEGPSSVLDNEAPLYDGTTGKVIKGSGITLDQIIPVNADLGALNQAATQTLLDQNKAKRINATFSQVSAAQMTTDSIGNVVYAGVSAATLSMISTISGTLSSGTNISANFYAAKGNTGITIISAASGGVGITLITTSAPHGYSNGDRVLQEDTTFYDNDYVIANVTATTYEITEAFVSTQTGTVALLIETTKASNDFSNQSKNTTLVAHVPVVTNDFIYIAVENTGNAAEWDLDDIHEIYSRV